MLGKANPQRSTEFDPDDPSNSVSVIIAVYNGERFIKATVESILSQTVQPLEVIAVDDESPDESVKILEGFGDRVRIIHTPNGGAAAARNLGATQARGRWLAFCDQDDLWHPSKLEKQLRLASECPDIHCVLVDYSESTDGVLAERSHFSYAPVDFWSGEQHESGFVVREPITGKLSSFQPGITSTVMVLKDFYRKSGGYDLEVEWGAEDTCFHFRCLSTVPFGVVPEVLMYYNRHADAGSADSLKQLRKTVVVWEHIIATYPQAQPYRAELLKGVAAIREEIQQCERHARRQRWKRRLGIG